jgi:hypothetical protein
VATADTTAPLNATTESAVAHSRFQCVDRCVGQCVET